MDSTGPVDFEAGWVLTDAQNKHPFEIPADTPVELVPVFHQGRDFQFGLGAVDTVYLKDPTGKVVDSYSWTQHADGAFCRSYFGEDKWLDDVPSPGTSLGCDVKEARPAGSTKPPAENILGPVVEVGEGPYFDFEPKAANLKVGDNFSYQIKATADSKLTYSATGLPAGITVNASTGLVSGKTTASGVYSPTILVTDAHGNTAEAQRFTFDIWVDVYTTPGEHTVNGRKWRTACEPYSQTTRCRTEIWASQFVDPAKNNGNHVVSGWAFNNLTYLPSDRSLWKNNPLAAYAKVGGTAEWTASDGYWTINNLN